MAVVGAPGGERLEDGIQIVQGARFELGSFHDRFLEMGRLPLPLMRTAFLDDTGTGLRASSP